jgi:GTP1/Obg family GTP-binding protein
LAPAIVFVTDASGTSGYPLEVQQALRAELRARYPQAPWLEVQGKFDLEQEAPLGEGALAVSATEGTGVDELKQAVIAMLLPG